MAMPRRARAGGSSRSATRLRAPRGSPAASARAAEATRESMFGRIHVDPVRRSTGTCIDTTQTYARIRPAQLKQAVVFYERKAVDVLRN